MAENYSLKLLKIEFYTWIMHVIYFFQTLIVGEKNTLLLFQSIAEVKFWVKRKPSQGRSFEFEK